MFQMEHTKIPAYIQSAARPPGHENFSMSHCPILFSSGYLNPIPSFRKEIWHEAA